MGSVAADASPHSIDTMGMASQILRGGFPVDGALARQRKIVVFGNNGGSLELDLGRETPIAAILIQALHDDHYSVEVAVSKGQWNEVWRVVPTDFDSGQHSRHHVFDEPVRARWLRIQNEARERKISAIRAIRVFSEVPTGWPASVQVASKQSKSAYPWLSLYSVTIAKFVIALAAALLMVVVFWSDRVGAQPTTQRFVKRLVISVCLLAGLCWWNLFQYTTHNYAQSYANDWDIYHYYLGSKYAPELRYTNIYHCSVVADTEDGLDAIDEPNRHVRDLRSNEPVPVAAFRANPDGCKRSFSSERWESFKHDNAWFRTRLPPDMWQKLTLDHGYNPSPAWAIVGRTLASLAPASSTQMFLLRSLDTVLLVVMWNMIWVCFGWRAAAAAIAFWGTNYTAGNWFTAAAFLRNDWLFMVVAGVCCLKRERMALGGFMLAYATLLRVFPGFLVLGVLLKIASDAFNQRSLRFSPPHGRFVMGAAVGVIVVVLLSFLANGRATVWQEFAKNTQKHVGMSGQNVGLDRVLEYFDDERAAGEFINTGAGSRAAEANPSRKVLFALAFLPLLFVAVRKEEAWAAAVLGIGWLPFVVGLTNYYWAMFLLFALLTTRKPVLIVGVAAMTLIWSAMGLIYPLEIDHPWPPFGGESYSWPALYMWSSAALMMFIVWATALFALQRSGGAPGVDASGPIVGGDVEGRH